MGWTEVSDQIDGDKVWQETHCYDFQDGCSHHLAKKAEATLIWDICRQTTRQRSRLRTVQSNDDKGFYFSFTPAASGCGYSFNSN